MPACPSCRRPVAMARPRCIYCGAALDAGLLAELRPPEPEPPPAAAAARTLVVAAVDGADPARLAAALELRAYEAQQRSRRGGLQLVRVGDAAAADAVAARLKAAGVQAWTLAEEQLRAAGAPLPARGGRLDGERLLLRTGDGELPVEAARLLLIVRGPIAREYQPEEERRVRRLRQLRIATLEAGYRYHLHRRDDPRPVEMDPAEFAFEPRGASASGQREMASWLEVAGRGVEVDDGFRREPPALAPAAPEPGALPAAFGAQPARGPRALRAEAGRLVLDNVAQFRFYSAWRGAVERLRRG